MDWILSGIILTTFFILGATRLSASIRTVALQGALLSVLPILQRGSFLDLHGLILFSGTLLIKSLIIPTLLFRSIRETTIQKETGAIASRHFSLLMGGILMVIAFSWGTPPGHTSSSSPLLVPVALSTVLLGFLLLITRTKAVTQVIGFLVLDNGIFLFGMTLFADFPLTVEMGVLLDLLVGVFVMGIMIHQIHRTFDHIDTARLTTSEEAE